jgi:hypothetical protein
MEALYCHRRRRQEGFHEMLGKWARHNAKRLRRRMALSGSPHFPKQFWILEGYGKKRSDG